MIDKNVSMVWADAAQIDDRDAFVSDWGLSSIWGDPEEITDEQVAEHTTYAGRIWDAAHMSARELVARSGLTQAAFAERYCIGGSTVEAWCRGTRTPPEYAKLLLAQDLGLL